MGCMLNMIIFSGYDFKPATVYKKGKPSKKEQYTDSIRKQYIELSTGASEKFKIFNIYDMAGNMWEWSTEIGIVEGENMKYVVLRGGSSGDLGNGSPIVRRYGYNKLDRMGISYRFPCSTLF